MGNNTSTTRKSTAGTRSSNNGYRKASRKENDLEEEFSDLILHEVSKQKQNQVEQSILKPIGNEKSEEINSDTKEKDSKSCSNEGKTTSPSNQYNKFTDDLIEDEFNELNDGLLETETPDLARNILPNREEVEADGAELEDHNKADDRQSNFKNKAIQPDLKRVQMDREQSRQQMENNEIKRVKPDNMDSMDIDRSESTDQFKVGFGKLTQQSDQDATPNNHLLGAPNQPGTTNRFANNGATGTNQIPVEIKWVNVLKENIQKISIIGSFSNWRDVLRLHQSPEHPNEYVTTIFLPLGVHKLLYIINNEYRVSDMLPTATDQEGIFFNWFEVLDEAHLFNHSHNQPNHVNASTAYDANIIQNNNNNKTNSTPTQTAGRYEVDRIKKKSNSFLMRVSKAEERPEFEHIEYEETPSESEHQTTQVLSPPLSNNDQPEPVTPPVFGSTLDSNSNVGTPNYFPYKEGSFLSGYEPEKITYSSEIPEMFVNYDYFKNKSADYQLPEPPQLPAQLNNVLLNKISNQNPHQVLGTPRISRNGSNNVMQPSSLPNDPFRPPPNTSHYSNNHHNHKRPPLRRADSSYYASNQEAYHLSIPNHVILNHLMTTSIRNDVLTVACITRYSGKFVTQIMHSPAE